MSTTRDREEDSEDSSFLLPQHQPTVNTNNSSSSSSSNDADDDDEDYDLLTAGDDNAQEPDYYTLLNLRRHPPPTDAQIRSAYRALTLSFHPDKQPAHLAEAAKQHFERIREAYETLIDGRKRVVYDLLGAEGVREEFGEAERVGSHGAAAEWRVGLKAKSPQEFRRWFLERMKARERKAVNSLVEGKGSFTLGVDASNTITIDEDAGEVYLNVPDPKLSKFGVAFAFKAPLPTWRNIAGEDEMEDDDDNENENGADEDGAVPDLSSLGDGPEMVINAGISGKIRHLTQKLQVQIEDQEPEVVEVPVPLVISTKELQLGVGVHHAFGDLAGSKGILGKPALSFLQYSGLALNASVLPFPQLDVNWAKPFTLVRGTRPFRLELNTVFQRPVWAAPPMLGARLSKQIGDEKHVFANLDSGTLVWPVWFRQLLSPSYEIQDDFKYLLSIPGQLSQFQFGLLSQPTTRYMASIDDDEDDGELDEDVDFEDVRSKHRKNNRAAEAWQVGVAVSPAMGGLSFNYSRNIFSGKPSTDASLSQWSSEGHYRLPQENEPRSVRIGVQSTVGFDLSLGWHIEGTRRVGDLARMGLGVGVQSANGLVMTLSWSRLGQNIRLPITVCSFEAANADAAAVAVLLPWVAYCALEFGFIRPRERRKHRRVIARRQKQLKKLVPKKREESQQAIQLMMDQVQRRRDREAAHDGLVITRAEYGHYPKKKRSDGSERDPDVADVTVPVMALVDNGQLVISKNSAKFHILGFYDPAPLLPKTLKIWYTYHGKEHYVEAGDKEGVTCPMRSHMV
ncbi:J domain-containing protein [Aspergillus fijiensis CBS 313.89]|uniref:Molecular chaperone n=1 Tax=Aspergillus fijiensis CBS 313.89 TaxID=1448319 RepID=A0A8G1W4M5_9EURO|nr:molecular chaperone [Aspergillus fijiensis CBS 313.89]RAK80329.1 molecular chaperone [Aspergillus fijiensis CBS 313.89]